MTALVSDATRHQLTSLQASQPRWKLLLSLWEQVFQEDAGGAWSATTSCTDLERKQGTPLLAGATIRVSALVVNTWFRRLITQITKDFDRGFALNGELANRLDPLGLLEAAITQDEQLIGLLAMQADIEPGPLEALSRILAAPALLTIGQQLVVAIPEDWDEGVCPICGAWAAIVERRGMHQSRYLRCGRCGSDWMGSESGCAFCASNQVSYLPSSNPGAQSVEICTDCGHYIKVIVALRPMTANEVILADLSSVALDFRALDHGFTRPRRPITTFHVHIDSSH